MAPRLHERHTVQLASLQAIDLRALRRPTRESDPAKPRLAPRNADLVNLSEDGRALDVRLRVALRLRLADEETWEIHVVLLGHFTADRDLTSDQAESFARDSGLYVLWPFARAHIDQLARLAGITSAPQLPLIVRPRPTSIGESSSPNQER